MNDLPEKLQEAISETERIALAALSHPGNYDHEAKAWVRTGTDDGVWSTGGGYSNDPCRVGGMGITIYDEGGHDEHQAEHIAHNDPNRVLRRVARDRKLLERHKPYETSHGPCCHDCSWNSLGVFETWPCPDVRDLAEDYEIEEVDS